MSKLREFKSWLSAYKKANGQFPDEAGINLKIKDLLREEGNEKKVNSKQIYFRDSEWSDYTKLRNYLAEDAKFVKNYAGVDLKAYIESALAWSEKGNTSTNMGWLLTLKNWMRRAKNENRLLMKPKAPVKDAFNNQ